MKKIFLYGIGGACDSYRLIRYVWLDKRDVSIRSMLYYASKMVESNPFIRTVYALDNRYGLSKEAQMSLKHPSIENCIVFKDTLEREGIRIM